MTAKFTLPNRWQQISIMGRNGSGKTQMGAWILSHAAFDKQPYVLLDYKFDSLLNSIPRIKEIDVDAKIPRHPGLYIVHPSPHQITEVEALLWRIWEKENVGLYIDEAHIVPNKGAFQAILTQGRSKRIPRIVLTQRPAWVNRFTFSEANFYSVFHLNDLQDQKRVQDFVPVDLSQPLPKYNSWWHSVDDYSTFQLRPVQDKDMILDRFDRRMPRSWFGVRNNRKGF